jgi:type II secretory pathway component PulF
MATPKQRRALLRLIATGAEERLSLPQLIEAWSGDERGAQRFRLRRLAASLRNGAALNDALERFPGLLSDDEVLMVRFATESGTLAPTIRQRLMAVDDGAEQVDKNWRQAWNYLYTMIGVFFALLLLMVLYLGRWYSLPFASFFDPLVEQIADDFGQPTPVATYIAGSFDNLLLNVGAGLLLVALLHRWLRWPGRLFRRRIAPLFSGAIRSRRIADVLRRLGESAAAGRPLSGAIATLARHHYEPSLRHKLLYVRNELSLGAELWPTLQSAGMLSSPESAALKTSEPLGTSAWTLSALAEARSRRAIRRLTWQSSLLLPAIVLVFGSFVLVHVLSLFTFMTQLIQNLAL